MEPTNIIALLTVISLILICIICFFIIRGIWRAIKRFTFEVIDRANGTSPKINASKKGYTAEARKACEKVTPKQKQDTTPPWEQ